MEPHLLPVLRVPVRPQREQALISRQIALRNELELEARAFLEQDRARVGHHHVSLQRMGRRMGQRLLPQHA
eukprot:45537-Eustigmatos_ZCMA.PRE.1